MNEEIIKILYSKPNNNHYMNRYIKFISSCSINRDIVAYESHHICPKATELFPEYAAKQYSWNFIKLTYREHFIAHWILWKAFNNISMSRAFFLMSTKNGVRIKSSRILALMKDEHAVRNRKMIQNMVDTGTHPSFNPEFKINAALRMHKYNLNRIIKRKYSRYKIDIDILLKLKLLTLDLNVEFRNEWIPHTKQWMLNKIKEIENDHN